MIVSKTPLRVSLFGGGTDYPEYARDNPSAVLGGTINKYIYITALPLAPFAEQKYRISYKVVEDCNDIDEISHPVIREVLRKYEYNNPTGFYTVSDIPGSTGLGSSSSFTVGFINLVKSIGHRYCVDNRHTAEVLANEAIDLERNILKENVGVQDQTHAAFGGFARYDFDIGDNNYVNIKRKKINMNKTRIDELNNSMLLVFTGIQRHASKVVKSQIDQIEKGVTTNYLNTMYEMVDEAERILTRTGYGINVVKDIGYLLNESWNLKKELSDTITNPIISDIYNVGIDLGAYGGKLLGAGGGGFVLFVLPPNLKQKLRDHFGVNNVIDIEFSNNGSQIINV